MSDADETHGPIALTRGHPDPRINETITRAMDLTEQALVEVMRIAIQEIRSGLESSQHVDAAERGMRDALRQLALAQREERGKRSIGTRVLQSHSDGTGDPATRA